MGKIKIRDLAHKNGMPTRELIRRLARAGFRVSTGLAEVDEAKATAAVFPVRDGQGALGGDGKRGAERDIEGGMDDEAGAQIHTGGAVPAQTVAVRIKKYENRRLYSATHRRHLTLEEVGELVRQGLAIEVTDATDARDLTSEILMQILIEQGRARDLPAAVLLELVRAQDEAVRNEFSRLIQGWMQLYLQAGREVARAYSKWPMAMKMPMPMFSSQLLPPQLLSSWWGLAPWSKDRPGPGKEAGIQRQSSHPAEAAALREAESTIERLNKQIEEMKENLAESEKKARNNASAQKVNMRNKKEKAKLKR